MEQFEYAALSGRLEQLTQKILSTLESVGGKDKADSLRRELSEAASQKEVTLAFAGQYSAGKSTLISALTGNRAIKIDANVSTDRATRYPWNGLVLVDTPGILAGKHEEHDRTTAEALQHADLVVYVITSQLFDEVVFKNFLHLAYEQQLAPKMMLVVNKMNMEDAEYDTLVSNYTSSLRSLFSERGHRLDDFPLAFVDAYDYLDGLDHGDQELIEFSHFAGFVKELNAFAERNGLVRKHLETPVRIIQGALANLQVTQENGDLGKVTDQAFKSLNRSEQALQADGRGIMRKFISEALDAISPVAMAYGVCDPTEMDVKAQQLELRLQDLLDQAIGSIGTAVNKRREEAERAIGELVNKESFRIVDRALDAKLNSPHLSSGDQESCHTQKFLMDKLKQLGDWVGKDTGMGAFTQGIKSASGSMIHQGVKSVGHFLGHSFKPWEAVRTAANIGRGVAVAVPVLSIGADLFFELRDARKADQAQQKLRDKRQQYITDYRARLDAQSDAVLAQLGQLCEESFGAVRQQLEEGRQKVIEAAQASTRRNRIVADADAECVAFIKEIGR